MPVLLNAVGGVPHDARVGRSAVARDHGAASRARKRGLEDELCVEAPVEDAGVGVVRQERAPVAFRAFS